MYVYFKPIPSRKAVVSRTNPIRQMNAEESRTVRSSLTYFFLQNCNFPFGRRKVRYWAGQMPNKADEGENEYSH